MGLDLVVMNDKFDTDPLQPLDSDDFLPPISRWTKLSGMFLVGTFGAAIALSGLIQYKTTVDASGMVRPSQELQVVEAATSGKLKGIFVNENQTVKAGDAIARIDDIPLKSRKSQLQTRIEQLQSQQAELQSQIYRSNRRTPPQGMEINEQNFPSQGPQIQQYKQIGQTLDSARQEFTQLNQALENSVIRTPVAGTILNLEARNIGQQIRPGERIAQIVPSGTPMVVKANVPVDAYGQVEVGQSVQLRVSAYPYPDYGTLQGKVSAIAPDTVTPQKENNDTNVPAVYYEVTIQPEKTYLTKRDRPYYIQPGMGVTAKIISREETLLTFLLRKARLLADV